MSARHLRRVIARAIVAALLVVSVTAVAAGAHVSIVPPTAPRSSFSVVSFNVPNEKADANTTKIEILFPAKQPIPFVSVRPMAGWTVAVEKVELAKPVTVEGTRITEVVSKVTWTATGPGLSADEFDFFTVSAGPLPARGASMTFKALQTYSDGEVVRWIQPTVKGSPEPDHPSPVLLLTKGT